MHVPNSYINCDIKQEDEMVSLKKKIESLKENIAEKEDKELTKLKTENLKLQYQINHLEKVKKNNWNARVFKKIIELAFSSILSF